MSLRAKVSTTTASTILLMMGLLGIFTNLQWQAWMICGAMGLLTFLLFEVLVLKPLAKFVTQVKAIAASDRFNTHIKMEGRDQIASLAGSVNQMLDSLRALNTALQKKTAEAETATRAKNDFLTNMSHELRTPITAIVGYSDIVSDQLLGRDEQLKAIETIRRNAKNLQMLVSDILDLTVIEANKLKIENIECQPRQVLAEMEALMKPIAEDKHLKFRLKIADNVPTNIRSDPARIRQILVNLLSNAVKFTDQGSVSVSVRVLQKISPTQCRLQFLVEDTGIGMNNDQVANLFTAFSQMDGALTRKFGGTGLGLFLCKRLAELLSGTISVASAPKLGSQFALNIPVEIIEVAEKRLDDPDKKAKPVAISLADRRILLAEDGPDNQRLLKYYIERTGARLEIVENGLAAINRINDAVSRGQDFDLVLMDMQMPELDGFSTTRMLRDSGYARPIVALTAQALQGDRERCLEAGCDEYLTKPVDYQKLIQTIAHFCHKTGEVQAVRITSELSKEPMMREIVDAFIEELPRQISRMNNMIRQQDFLELKRLVHHIKGSGTGYGYPILSEVATRAEIAMAKHGNIESAIHLVESMIDTIRSVEGYDREKEVEYAARLTDR